ncbi:MAG: rhodanese-like domain-containing protein [Candidatus Melainabacteria bacterium]|jgi:rhodanese-related sulfurtransferase|nr:rhodanese-like domain-containing protein [Candidatus Melainabacteria bacterium]
MTVESPTRILDAAAYFEAKLAYEIGPIGLKMAIENGENYTIVDLRTPELFAKGHIPGAINLKFEELDKNLDKLSKDKTTVVYCYDIVCHLSSKAALELAKKGYKVKELVGGFDTWAEKDLKVEGTGQSHKSSSCCG